VRVLLLRDHEISGSGRPPRSRRRAVLAGQAKTQRFNLSVSTHDLLPRGDDFSELARRALGELQAASALC